MNYRGTFCSAVTRSGSEEGSYLRLVDYLVSLNSRPRVITKKKKYLLVDGVDFQGGIARPDNPIKSVNLFLMLVIMKDKLTDLCGD